MTGKNKTGDKKTGGGKTRGGGRPKKEIDGVSNLKDHFLI